MRAKTLEGVYFLRPLDKAYMKVFFSFAHVMMHTTQSVTKVGFMQ